MSRTALFEAIEAKLNTISGLLVKLGKLDIDEPIKPVAGAAPLSVDHTRTSKRTQSRVLEFNVQVLSDSLLQMEETVELVKAAMLDDPTWGALATDTELRSEEWLFFHPVFPQDGTNLRYAITY